MSLSTLGRVLVIDDEYIEIQPLLEILGKENIPYLYFEGKLEHLPVNPITGVRFVFMDIELGPGFAGQDIKTKASGITAVLQRIISPQNGPYVLIAWTKHNEVIQQVVENCHKINIPAVNTLNLEKTECLNVDDKIQYITQKLQKSLREIGAFQLYIDWENMLNDAAKDFISKFSSFFPIDNEWSKNTEVLFYKLYKAYVEKNERSDKHEQVRCSLHLLNRSYLDTLENITAKYNLPKNFGLSGGHIDKEVVGKLNTSLFIIDKPNIPKSPGSVYQDSDQDLLKPLKEDCFKNVSNSITTLELCRIIITPECDIAQKKLFMHRIVYGILYKESPEIEPKRGIHLFLIGPLEYKNEICRIILNFQTITSLNPENINDDDRLFAVKRDLLFDIQSKAANHVNRLGNYMLK